MAADPYECSGYFFRRQDEIHGPGRDCAFGHAVVFCRLFVLGKDDPAPGLYIAYAERTVGAGPRENDADCLLALVLGERPEKRINRHMLGMDPVAWQKPEFPVEDGQGRIGRNDVYMVGFRGHAVLYLAHGHGSAF